MSAFAASAGLGGGSAASEANDASAARGAARGGPFGGGCESRDVLAFVNATARRSVSINSMPATTLAHLQPHSRRAPAAHTSAVTRAVDARAVARGGRLLCAARSGRGRRSSGRFRPRPLARATPLAPLTVERRRTWVAERLSPSPLQHRSSTRSRRRRVANALAVADERSARRDRRLSRRPRSTGRRCRAGAGAYVRLGPPPRKQVRFATAGGPSRDASRGRRDHRASKSGRTRRRQ